MTAALAGALIGGGLGILARRISEAIAIASGLLAAHLAPRLHRAHGGGKHARLRPRPRPLRLLARGRHEIPRTALSTTQAPSGQAAA